MGKRRSKKSDAVQYPHELGFNALVSIQPKIKDALGEFEKEMEWLYELLYECKKSFSQPTVQLLPRTPSQKKRRKPKRPAKWMDEEDVLEPPIKRLSVSAQGGGADEDYSSPPMRTTRTRAASRTAASTRPKRNTRNTKTVQIKIDSEPVFSLTKEISSQNDITSNETDVNATPTNKATLVNSTPVIELTGDFNTPKASDMNNVEETPKAADSDQNMVVQETPEVDPSTPATPKTVVRQNNDSTPVSSVRNESVDESPKEEEENSPEEQSKKSRTSVRKSLKHGKTLNSSTRLSSIKRLSMAALHKVEAAARSASADHDTSQESTQSESKSPETKSTRPRTRLRLKKGSQNTDSVGSEKSVLSEDSAADNENSTEDEQQPQRTRTKARKITNKTEPGKKTRTKVRSQQQSGEEKSSIELSDDEVMLIDHDTPQKDSDNDNVFKEGADKKDEGPRTRTKQKNSSKVDSEEDSGITSMTETNLPRTRSKMRPPKGSQEDNFAKPDHPAPRTRTKKRVLSDDEADMSISKKTCMDESVSSDISVGVPCGSSTFLSSNNDNAMSTDDECTSSSDYDSPACPRDKVIRPKIQKPSFQHNLSNKIVVQNKPGIVKSFIKRNSPAKKLTSKEIQEQKKKELLEKEKKEQERLMKRQIEMQQKIEEQRKKNEEKAKKFAEAREQQAKRDQEMRDKILKRFEEKRQQNEKQKEEKAKEELKKQQQKMKKQQEADEKRKREEEEQHQKQQKLEEDNRILQETLEKKREEEEQKRQQKIAEEKKKYEEKLAALAKERQEEQEALRKKEEQKILEQQKIKEQREKQMALEKAEREKRAIEEKKQKDQLLKERMEKIKELEKKRLIEEEKRRAELREHEEAVRQIINNHNTSLKNTKEEILKTAMSAAGYNLNTTQTYSSKSHNPDSYDMTPAKTYKPSTFETYDISGLKSDDSTDDEDAPKKKIPNWASGPNLKAALINQHYYPPDLEQMFDAIIPPDLNELFVKKKARFNKRTSSAHWDSPILPPGSVGLHTGLTYF